ncbi:topoisomerase II, partial [Streptomyces sp. SID5998]|nr:topoisomerase II [Streptomyces sp. SID5998]
AAPLAPEAEPAGNGDLVSGATMRISASALKREFAERDAAKGIGEFSGEGAVTPDGDAASAEGAGDSGSAATGDAGDAADTGDGRGEAAVEGGTAPDTEDGAPASS